MFFNKNFEYAGTIGQLDYNKGNYNGVYIITLPKDFGKIKFKEHSNSGCYRGKNPVVAVEKLKEKWIDNEEVLYIGKAESQMVKKRMLKHIKFWNGEPVAAYGGRVIEQIENIDQTKNYKDLEVWYLKCDNPKQIEAELQNDFVIKHGKLPFANWKKESLN